MRYVYLKQKVFSFREAYKVYDELQNVLYEARGKWVSFDSHKDLFKVNETEPIFVIKQKILSFVPTYFLFDKNRQPVAKLAQQLFTFFGTKFNLIIQEKKYELRGDFFGYTFTILDEQGPVVDIRKKWLSWGDTYQIAIDDRFDEALAVSVVLMIDDFIADQQRKAAGGSAVILSSGKRRR
jgi:uncharacterized protein YxjI